MPQPLNQSLHQSEWHLKAQTKLTQLEEELDQQKGEILLLEGELCTPGQYMGLHNLVWAPMNHIMYQVSEEPPHPIEHNLLPKTIKVKHLLGKLKGLYSNHISDFNINWQISDLTETIFSLELVKETPARTWKYLNPAKFWPKGISYCPIESSVKVSKHSGFEMEHLLLTKLYLQKTIQGRNSI